MESMRGEVVLNIPAQRAWHMFMNDQVISKINPEMLASAKFIEGDGGPGSVRLFKLGPAVKDYVKESIQKIDQMEIGRSVTYHVVGGDLPKMYDPYRVTFSFTPVQGQEKDKCVAQWKAEFRPLTLATPPPEKARDAALGFLTFFDKVQLSY
ncbi:Polyketide cyclase/dehydrase and lipid transport superfamily protein [Tripterygium wilfordii]|uniref:Polyketide cyclase/dehydrase and lipid transport superfamily protein n=1 Tax=Tripterygium wilfordii TaxID=458696 RepID=A0A7J7DHX5_TRIWF|nr:phytohormone-binding protein CSBP-like [Tripterygium wilfordii]KAF5745951.1 Polyketide cyclase/dehydrase and lipid transport superfamily protein [Tripterygium wilfordii]